MKEYENEIDAMENGMCKEFTKDMLKSGDLVELKDGSEFVCFEHLEEMVFVDYVGDCYISSYFNSDLTHPMSDLDIVKVRRTSDKKLLVPSLWHKMPCIWERKEEPEVVEISASEAIEELEKLKGCKVKLVK